MCTELKEIFLPKKTYQWPTEVWCDIFSTLVTNRKCKSKVRRDMTSYPSEWLLSKRKLITSVGKNVKKREPSCPVQFSSVQFSGSVVSKSLWPHESQHARPPCPSPTPGVYPNSCPSSQWCHPANSSSVIPFSS